MTARMKASDAILLDAYARLGSVWKVAEEVGLCGQSVHERLEKIGAITTPNYFTEVEEKRLEREYAFFADAGKLEVLAKDMGRTRHFLCRQARSLGLTNKNRARPYVAVWKYLSDTAAEVIWEDFKSQSLGMGAYCRKKGYDDLGFARTMRERFADEYDSALELKVPKQTLYRFGRQFEYRVRDDLRDLGYFVLRSPQSRSPIDLLAIAPGLVLFVQCKRGGFLGVREWNEFYELAASTGAIPVLALIPKVARGVEYRVLLDKKDGSKRAQPFAPYPIPDKRNQHSTKGGQCANSGERINPNGQPAPVSHPEREPDVFSFEGADI